MTKLQNVFVALVNMDIFQMTLKLRLFTVEFYSNVFSCGNPHLLQLVAVPSLLTDAKKIGDVEGIRKHKH